MQTLQIPASIWLNLVVLVAAGLFVWFRLSRAGSAARRAQGRGRRPGKPAPADR